MKRLYPTYDVDQGYRQSSIYWTLPCDWSNVMILPCGTADYYRYLAQWSDSDTTLVVQQCDINQLAHPYLVVLHGIMHSCVALVLYVITALKHYIPYMQH